MTKRPDVRPRTVGSGAELHRAWTQFLGRWQWVWYVTLTFREPVSEWAADKRFRLWIKRANREAYGPRWHKHGKGIQWVRAAENQGRRVPHYHALLARVGDFRLLSLASSWKALGGGFERIQPVRSQRRARRYVTKVVSFGGELDLGGPWDGQLSLPGLGVTLSTMRVPPSVGETVEGHIRNLPDRRG